MGTKSGTAATERGTTKVTETTASGRRRTTEVPPGSTQDNGAGGKYRVDGKGIEEKADESAKWSRDETEELASEEEAETTGGVGEAGRTLMATAGESKGIGAEYEPGGAAAGRGNN